LPIIIVEADVSDKYILLESTRKIYSHTTQTEKATNKNLKFSPSCILEIDVDNISVGKKYHMKSVTLRVFDSEGF
jgi:hypothetical protein